MYRFSVFLINVQFRWKYLIRESPEIQSRSLLHLSISSSISSALSLLCALKTSLNKCFLPLNCQGSCTLPRWAIFMVLSTFQNVPRFSPAQGITLLWWDIQKGRAHAARRGGDRDAAKAPVPQSCFYLGMGTSIPTCSCTWALWWELLHIPHGVRHLSLGSEKVQF